MLLALPSANVLWIHLVRGNEQREMECHSISSSLLYLDKFYKNKMELKVISKKTNFTPKQGTKNRFFRPIYRRKIGFQPTSRRKNIGKIDQRKNR